MNERSLTEALMVNLRQQCRGSKVIKHSDRVTSGIPDVSMSWRGDTYWIEVKYLRPRAKRKDVIDSQQMISCHDLSVTTNGKCWIVMYEDPRKGRLSEHTVIWTPHALAHEIFPRMVPVGGPAPEPYLVTPRELEPGPVQASMQSHGVIYVPGICHSLVSTLIWGWSSRRG